MKIRTFHLAALLASTLGACSHAHEAPPATEVVVQAATGALPGDPDDAQWARASEFDAPLILQDMVEPRLLVASTLAVRVRALTDGARIAFRLEWKDARKDDVQMPATFTDACAVQLPSKTTPDVPAPQMGEPGRPVEITHWRASWQAVVDGRPDTIQALHPNAIPFIYPFDAASLKPGSEDQLEMQRRYAPARALGNQMAGPREKPVEDLVAEGPGTLGKGSNIDGNGRGKRTADGWAVVISRRLPSGLAPGQRTQVAFAIWEGAQQEVGARKMRSGWTPMLLEVKP
jgi:DMSO reductase family type II enzyme heme b subunit